jgi:ATPase subunit of ABC transporter with duplicated ATPase domains
MIRLDKISRQNGKQILFIEASAALQKGEKVGLVGPNGAGKTTLFRMITGEEQPDEGQVAADRGITIGYFSQDVGEMAGRSVVSEVMDGAGPVSAVGAELKELEAALADPARADEMDAIIEHYGEVQARFQELDGYGLEGRAYEVLAGLGFSQEMMDGDVGALSGGWKMRVALARILLMNPDVMLLDEPSNHLDLESLIWLEAFLKGYEGALMMTSHDREFMNRIVGKVIEIDGGALTTYSGDYAFYEQQRALNETQQQAQFERQQAMLAKEIKFIERFKARASHAAQVQSRVKKLDKIERVEPPKRRQTWLSSSSPPLARARTSRASRTCTSATEPEHLRRPRFLGAPQGALVRDGRQRRRQVHAAEAGGRHRTAGRRHRGAGREREAGLLRAARDGPARRRAHGFSIPGGFLPPGRAGLAARAGRLLRVLRR